MKKNLNLKIALLTILSFALAGLFAKIAGRENISKYWEGISTAITNDFNNQNNVVVLNINRNTIDELAIDSTSADIKIEASPDEQIHLHYVYKGDGAEYTADKISKIEGTKLSFNLDKFVSTTRNVKFNFHGGVNFNAEMDNVSTRLKIPEGIKKISIKLISGNLNMVVTELNELQVKSVSGDVHLVGAIKKSDVKTVSGDIKFLAGNKSPDANLATTSGDIKMLFTKMPDIKVNFTTDSGQIKFDHEFAKASIEGSVKDFSIGNGTGHVELLTVSGDAVVGRVK